ncbi:GntR family transcriptional regulator [Peribacillus muralis]|uniref:GntR family transcriptional regulator n=1 Tax=Peribacillus muralis TaxID=264697 RepID=UPI001F4DD546|nr:GntR family transcriptional regulator [Peribacillus muralis]MCK1991203.1 GntR family transcriptional regulator [Peribacillus muralis]MCK2011757.1 GntR family transcriptional regulator [Peribacillus muralis]
MIHKNSPIPIYYQLEEAIKKAIQNHRLLPGEMIPSERDYTEKYEISRMTVRQAISNLVNDGYLYRQRGIGTFVAHQKIEQPLQGLTSFSEDMQSRGHEPSTRVISLTEIKADSDLAAKLEVEAGTPIVELKRVRLADRLPMSFETVYLSKDLSRGMTEEMAQTSFYSYIEKTFRLKIQYGRQSIEASIAQKTEAEMLGIAEGAPVLLIERISRLDSKKPFEVAQSVYRADRYKLTIDMERSS